MIIVTVGKDGTTVVAVQGVAGQGCRQLTAALEAALGTVTEQQLTMDYYLEVQEARLEDKHG